MAKYFIHNRRQDHRVKKALNTTRWSSVQEVQEEAGLSPTTTYEILDRLASKGEIAKSVVREGHLKKFYYKLKQ